MKYEYLGIYELRNYARTVGVQKPTTKRRNHLINEIKQIEQGILTPNKYIRAGRPPKNVFDKTSFLENMAIEKQSEAMKYEKLLQRYQELVAGIEHLCKIIKRK